MKKILIIPFMLLLISISVNALSFECNETAVLEEHFDFSDTPENHGWDIDVSDCNNAGVGTVTGSSGIFPDYSWGMSDSEGASATCSMTREFDNISSGKVLLSFNQAAINSPAEPFTLYLRTDFLNAGSSYKTNSIEINVETAGNLTFRHYTFTGDTCNSNEIGLLINEPNVYTINLELDFNANTYSLFMNDTAICENNALGLTHIAAIDYEIKSTGGGTRNTWLDDVIICEAETIITETEFPSLFCDDFDYSEAMLTRGWQVGIGGGQINTSFSPVNNELQLKNVQNIFPYHPTDAFETSYRPDSGGRFTRHIQSPIFSSQFTLNMVNQTDNEFFYTAMQLQNIIGYSVKAEIDVVGNTSGNMNWFYLNESQPSTVWKKICGNCSNADEDLFIKINSFFAHRDEFPFNSSNSDDEILIYSNYELLGTIEDFLDARTTHFASYEFGKQSEGNYTIDDYCVMVGTDTIIPTFEQYYTDYFIDSDIINETIDYGVEGTGDMAAALATIWDDMGLLSIASRIMTGLFLMFLLALIMFGMALKTGHPLSPAVLIVVEMFFMVLLVYIKLLPIWLPFVIVLIAAGIGAAVIKLGTQT